MEYKYMGLSTGDVTCESCCDRIREYEPYYVNDFLIYYCRDCFDGRFNDDDILLDNWIDGGI